MATSSQMSEKPEGTLKSDVQSNIIKLIQNKGSLRFTDLLRSLKISKPVLSYHLRILQDDGTIEGIQKGREKHYIINKKAKKNFSRQRDIFSADYSDFADEQIIGPDHLPKDLFLITGQTLTALFLHTVVKSVETGKDWSKAVDVERFTSTILFPLMDYIYGNDIPDELSDAIASCDFSNIKKMLKDTKNPSIQDNINQLNLILEKLFPEEISKIKKL